MYAPSEASAIPDQKSPLRASGLTLRGSTLVASDRHQLGDGAAGRAKLHRDHPGVAHDLRAVGLDLLGRLLQVLDLDGEMVDAGTLARGAGLLRLRAGVVLDEREVDGAVG